MKITNPTSALLKSMALEICRVVVGVLLCPLTI